MTSPRTSSNTIWESSRAVVTDLVREPVKEAVREALREEAAAVRPASGATGGEASADARPRRSTSEEGQSDDGRSMLTVAGAALLLVGVAYLARRRMASTSGSTWSEPSPGAIAADDAEGGYDSEGEMQTAESGGERGSDEGTGQ